MGARTALARVQRAPMPMMVAVEKCIVAGFGEKMAWSWMKMIREWKSTKVGFDG